MQKIQNLFLILLCLMMLGGCRKDHSYAYLMQHPQALKQAMETCQSNSDQISQADCTTIEHAVEDFNNLLLEQQSNPENFGQRIMDQEIACANIKQDKNADASKVKSVCDQVGTLLAVAGLSTPD